MSSNRLRLLLVSVMAVFAISAVASASASAAATCYPVAEKETGNFASSERCEKKEESTKGEWVAIEKLEKELKPGEWCAKVKVAKTGTFKNAGCTEAEAKGAFIKVKVSLDEWEVCEEAAGEGKEPPTKYDEHKCNTKAKALALRKWQWNVLGAGVTKKVKSSGGTFSLTAGGKVITCTAVTDKGTITGGKPGTDLAENITFTGCTTKQAGCEVKSAGGTLGTIVVPNIPTKLEQRVVGEEEVVVDNFEQNATTKEFVTLEFNGASCAGAGYVTTKVKGTVAAEVVPGTAELNFPATALEKDTLEAFGLKATLTGKDTQELENEWAFRAGEGPPATSLSTSLSGEGKEGETLTVLEGSKVKDKATLSGTNASKATGKVTYDVYSEGGCKTLVKAAGEVTVTSGSVPASSEEELEGGASYYWQATYSGDSNNLGSTSACGKEIETVKAAAPIAKEQLGGDNEASKNIEPCFAGKPVNCSTGNEMETQTDVAIGGRGPGLRVVRTYNALAAAAATEAGAWGYGWTGPYGAHLEATPGAGTATVYQENGSAVVFYKSGSEYAPAAWVQATLVESGGKYIYTLPDQSKLEFNSSGQLVKETERNGNSNTLTYTAGKLEKVEDGDKRTLTFTYNGTGQVETVTDPMKHVITYKYLSEQLTSVTIEGKVRWEFEYESPHLLKKIIDGDKHATSTEYEATTHRVSKQTIAAHERKFSYGTNETTLTEPNGSTTVETFNAAGEPTKIVRAKGKSEETTTEYEYEAGTYARTKLKDGNGHETLYGYDGEGNKTSETDPNKDERKWKYDKTHDIETETTPEGETTTIERNSKGEPTKIERPIGSENQITENKYAANGDLEEQTNPLGDKTKYEYDEAGDKKLEKDLEGNERKWKYNEDSQETEETSPRTFTTKTERNEYGLPKKIEDPLKHTTEYKYDGDQNVESETDGNKHTTEYKYNEENLRTKVIEANKDEVETEYDSEGQMIARKDGNGHTWHYKRNALEQVGEEENPLNQITKKKYDKAGNLESKEDPEKDTAEYKYDESNRLKEITYSTGKPSAITYKYSKDSKVTEMTDETGTTKNTYDNLDRLTESENGAKKVVKYKYDLANLPTTITYPNKKEIKREYDKDTRLEKVTDWNSKTSSFKYNPDSELEKTAFPSGTEDEDTYGYNEADQMTEGKYKGPSGASLGTLAYTRGGDGEVTKTTTTVLPGPAANEDKYDESNRLTEDNKLAYEYDKANNPTKLEGASPYSYSAADELEKGPTATYKYNGDDHRTETIPTTGPTITDGYDQAGNLTSLKRPEKLPITKIEDTFTYNGNNLRSSQDINGTTTNLTWDTAEELPLILEDETNSYIYGPGNLPIEQISSGGETLYFHHDQQGSTRLLTGSTGKTEAAFTYNPYGTFNATSGKTEATPLLYDAQYTTNIGTGAELIYLRARTYDPLTAQFLSVDPALETTGEPYTYAEDNPLNHADPTGECGGPNSWHCAFAKAAVVAATVALGVSGTLLANAAATAAGFALLPPTVVVTVPSTLVIAGVTAASFGALVVAIRWELYACAP